MENLKPVIIYKPARAEKRKADNSIIPDEFVGKMRTKVAPNTPGAFHQVGENAAGKKWNYWAYDVDSVNGVLRWIDCRTGDYGPTIELFLETPKSLRQITIPFDVTNLHDVVNHLCGLGKEVEVAMLNVSYWVRPKTDKDKKLVLDKNEKKIWKKNVTFRDVPPQFTFEQWKEFSAKHGLEWKQIKKVGGVEWDFEDELRYWIERVVKLQRFLLGTEKVLPFCWNSMTASASDGTPLTLTEGEIATAKNIYESVKPLYKMPFSRSAQTADDFEDSYDPNNPSHTSDPFNTKSVSAQDPGFPVDEVRNYENNTPDFGEDLPF